MVALTRKELKVNQVPVMQAIDLVQRSPFDGSVIVRLACRRLRELNDDDRALLFKCCWDHVVAECVSCRQGFRQHELAADLFKHRTHLCPRCRTDLTGSIREHLSACGLLRRRCAEEPRAHETHETSGSVDALSGQSLAT